MVNNLHKTPTRTKSFSIPKILGMVVLAVLAIVIINTVIHANQNFMNCFKDGFYFEKYSSAEKAKAALLEFHPIGSDIKALRRTLEKAGAKDINYVSEIAYSYIQNTESIFKSLWGVDINVDINYPMNIENISVTRMGTAK